MTYDVTVIGAGIVGLAVGYNLIKERPGISLAIVEKESEVAMHQTGRNSGVIHSGIYYKPGSKKAINCKLGYDLMVDFCIKEGIKHDICGKVIVATNKKEELKLQNIYARGKENGLDGLKLLQKEELTEIEPNVSGIKGIWVPQAGIVDYSSVAKRLYNILLEYNVDFLLGKKVNDIKTSITGYKIQCDDTEINTSHLVNCAGLYSDKIAKMNGVDLEAKIIPFRGEYYLLKKEKSYLVKNLIYPVPDPDFPFLGVHFTRRINGRIDAGPNAVLAFKREGYSKSDIDIGELFESLSYPGFVKIALKYWNVGVYEMYRSCSKGAFTKALQKLVPEITKEDLEAGPSGVRAQLCHKNGQLVDDFMIKYTQNAVHVVNAPSPAATSSLYIGKVITNKIIELL
ncbi:L-2-hydroxyglutarate oxidase [Maribacter algicola]|uniref:L-2-hydroxyglutarate oxidase n=1 Tax=Meishania litoralis TaxID=3434685 RepID=A0ACC7LSH8_9FLAO